MKISNKSTNEIQVPDEIKRLVNETTRQVVAQATADLANEINMLKKELKELRVDYEILKEGGDI